MLGKAILSNFRIFRPALMSDRPNRCNSKLQLAPYPTPYHTLPGRAKRPNLHGCKLQVASGHAFKHVLDDLHGETGFFHGARVDSDAIWNTKSFHVSQDEPTIHATLGKPGGKGFILE